MPDKKLGEMTPDERDAAIRRAAARFQDELDPTGPAIGKILEGDADATSGPPTTLTGLRRETRDRIRAAIVNSGETWPAQEITVTLPVRLAERSSADLAIAVSVLAAEGTVPAAALAGVMFFSELGLDGQLRPVPGVQAAAAAAAHRGLRTVMVAAENAADAALIPDVRVIAAHTLAEVIAWLRSSTRGRAGETCGTIGWGSE
jgi:magnesium chelatase family protein